MKENDVRVVNIVGYFVYRNRGNSSAREERISSWNYQVNCTNCTSCRWTLFIRINSITESNSLRVLVAREFSAVQRVGQYRNKQFRYEQLVFDNIISIILYFRIIEEGKKEIWSTVCISRNKNVMIFWPIQSIDKFPQEFSVNFPLQRTIERHLLKFVLRRKEQTVRRNTKAGQRLEKTNC